MVFNRHLKALNLCNHSDTIACVLYELLVNLELIIVSFQNSHQGSTSFSFVQFSRSCCAVTCFVTACILYIRFSRLSRGFLKVFLKKFSSKNGLQAVGKGFSGYRRGLGSRDSLIIIASSMTFVNRFLQVFLIFSTKFEGEVWARCILG